MVGSQQWEVGGGGGRRLRIGGRVERTGGDSPAVCVRASALLCPRSPRSLCQCRCKWGAVHADSAHSLACPLHHHDGWQWPPAPLLPFLSRLRSLSLLGNEAVTSATVRALAASPSATTLTDLNLAFCAVDNAALAALAAAVWPPPSPPTFTGAAAGDGGDRGGGAAGCSGGAVGAGGGGGGVGDGDGVGGGHRNGGDNGRGHGDGGVGGAAPLSPATGTTTAASAMATDAAATAGAPAGSPPPSPLAPASPPARRLRVTLAGRSNNLWATGAYTDSGVKALIAAHPGLCVRYVY